MGIGCVQNKSPLIAKETAEKLPFDSIKSRVKNQTSAAVMFLYIVKRISKLNPFYRNDCLTANRNATQQFGTENKDDYF